MSSVVKLKRYILLDTETKLSDDTLKSLPTNISLNQNVNSEELMLQMEPKSL